MNIDVSNDMTMKGLTEKDKKVLRIFFFLRKIKQMNDFTFTYISL